MGLAVVFVCKSLAQRGLENVWVLYTDYRYDWDRASTDSDLLASVPFLSKAD